MAATLAPAGKQHYTDDKGRPLAGGRLYTYESGTSTPKATFADANMTQPNTNPVVLDARGEATIYWSGVYKVVLNDSKGRLIWTADPVTSIDYAIDQSVGNAIAVINQLKSDLSGSEGAGLVGFIQEGPGAVPRTQLGKSRDIESVKDRGAVGDGITPDTAAFIASGNAASMFYVPAGRYKIDGHSRIAKAFGPGIALWGIYPVQIGDIYADQVCKVPEDFPDIYAALAYVNRRRIFAGTVYISISDGSYTLPTAIEFAHPDSRRIRIVGNVDVEDAVVLNIGNHDGFTSLHSTLNIWGVTLRSSTWTSHGAWTSISTALNAPASGSEIRAYKVAANKVYYGFAAGGGGYVFAHDCTADEAGDAGFFAFGGGALHGLGCSSRRCSDRNLQGPLGFGYAAEMATMWLRGCIGFHNDKGHVAANMSAHILADGCNFNGDPSASDGYGAGGGGAHSSMNSSITLMNCTVNNNSEYNVRAVGGSVIDGFYTEFNSSKNGVYVRGGSSANLTGCHTNNNTAFGVFADLGSFVTLNSSHESTGNLVNYSPAFGVSGNKNSWIDN